MVFTGLIWSLIEACSELTYEWQRLVFADLVATEVHEIVEAKEQRLKHDSSTDTVG